jgi:hypothetical protein
MNSRRFQVAGVFMALLLLSGGALANGVDVLDTMESQVVALEAAVAGAQAALPGASGSQRADLEKGIRAANGAISAFGKAIDALTANDMRAFRKRIAKAAERLAKAERKLGPTYLATQGGAAVAAVMRGALAAASGLVDADTGIGPRSTERAAKFLAKGDRKSARGNAHSATEAYAKGLKAVIPVPIPVPGPHRSVVLRALDGSALNIGIAVAPYSPKKTCGACHDYAQITEGFHFDQGRSVIRDDFAEGKDLPDYVLSDGMFGRW